MRLYHLAQLNSARLLAPLDSPQLAGFVARLADINALADAAAGFVWRFQTEEGNATALRPYDDDRLIINFSLWDGPESLRDFVYRTVHAEVMRSRHEWFERMADAYQVLWWVPAGHRPTAADAITRLDHLRAHGASPTAFTFKHLFPMPGSVSERIAPALTDECPAS